MKKLFAVLALAGVMVSCNNKKKEEKKTEGDTTIIKDNSDNTDNKGDKTTTDLSGVPTFSDPEVQKYVNDYTEFVTALVSAYRTHDATKIQQYSTKMTDWSSRSMSVLQKLAATPDESTKFSDYITKLSEQVTAAMTPIK